MIAGKINEFDFAQLGPVFERAGKLIETLNAKTPVGKQVIDDDLYVNVMEYDANEPFTPTEFEAHKKFVDIQIVLSGAECCAWNPIDTLEVCKPYVEEKDVMFYSSKGAAPSRIELRPGMFVIFAPEDGHNGKFTPSSGCGFKMRKAVVKVRL